MITLLIIALLLGVVVFGLMGVSMLLLDPIIAILVIMLIYKLIKKIRKK